MEKIGRKYDGFMDGKIKIKLDLKTKKNEILHPGQIGILFLLWRKWGKFVGNL